MLAVFIALFWLYFGPLLAQVELWGDGERDLIEAWAFAHIDWPGDSGPMVSHMPGLSLGPFWYIAVSVFISWAPAVSDVYALHVMLFVSGLAVLFRMLLHRYGVWAAASACLLLALSAYSVRTLAIVWHPSMLPAVACVWFVVVSKLLNTDDQKQRSRWLLTAWIVQAVMLQLNLVAAPYGAVLGLIQLHHWWRGGWRVSRLANSLCLGLLLVEGWFYLHTILMIVQKDAFSSTRGVPGIQDIVGTIVSMLGSGWVEESAQVLSHSASGWLVKFALGVTASEVTFSRATMTRRNRSATSLLSGLSADRLGCSGEFSPRLIPPFYN